jgi:hypothetical protein
VKLSEAMRRGVQIVPLQAYGANLERRVSGDEERSVEYRVCARGAAYVGAHEEIKSLEDVAGWDDLIRHAGYATFQRLFGWDEDGEPITSLPMQYEPGPGAVEDVLELSHASRPGEQGEILDLVITLNDRWHWSIAKIADWVESLGY